MLINNKDNSIMLISFIFIFANNINLEKNKKWRQHKANTLSSDIIFFN